MSSHPKSGTAASRPRRGRFAGIFAAALADNAAMFSTSHRSLRRGGVVHVKSAREIGEEMRRDLDAAVRRQQSSLAVHGD